MSKLHLTQVGRVAVSISDSDRAIDFYVNTLGFEKVVDLPMGPDARWVEVAIAGTPTTVALAPPPPGKQAGGAETGIILDTTDVDGDHAALSAPTPGLGYSPTVAGPPGALRAAGVAVDAEVARYGDQIPPMFWLRDPDGNSLCIVQPNP